MILPLVPIYILVLIKYTSAVHVNLQSLKTPLHVVNEKFLSFGLDTIELCQNFRDFDMTSSKLTQMMKYLSPAYFRVGGTHADQLIFCKKSDDCSHDKNTCVLYDSDWLKLHNIAKEANLDIVFDLNSLLRWKTGSWNPTNAEEMMQFSQDNGMKLEWELGNEPNLFEEKHNATVNATQMAHDYEHLRSILNKYDLYKSSSIVGPSTTRLYKKQIGEFLSEFLSSGGAKAVSAISTHHYYFAGNTAKDSQFLDPSVFDYLETCINLVTAIVRDSLHLDTSLWLGETASSYNSGAVNKSDRYLATFIWADKLGLSAQLGIDVVMRWTIVKGNYALLGANYSPNPDWWVSLLHKQIIDTSVIGVTTTGDNHVRLYAHCAKSNSLWSSSSSTVVVFGVNIQDKTASVQFDNLKSDNKVYVYELTTGGTNLLAHNIRLNGKILKLSSDLDLPDLSPNLVTIKDNTLTMPAYSTTFWVFTNTNVVACKK